MPQEAAGPGQEKPSGPNRRYPTGRVSLALTLCTPIPLSSDLFVSMHSWGLPRHPTLGLPIQNKVSLYLMVMADMRGIWQRQKRGLSLSNIAPYVV